MSIVVSFASLFGSQFGIKDCLCPAYDQKCQWAKFFEDFFWIKTGFQKSDKKIKT